MAHFVWVRQAFPGRSAAHRATVDAFWMDRYPVTNRQFREFVRATGHVTVAEIAADPKDYPGILPHMIYAGSLTFTLPDHPVSLRDFSQWWSFTKAAEWRHPYGPKSNIKGLDARKKSGRPSGTGRFCGSAWRPALRSLYRTIFDANYRTNERNESTSASTHSMRDRDGRNV